MVKRDKYTARIYRLSWQPKERLAKEGEVGRGVGRGGGSRICIQLIQIYNRLYITRREYSSLGGLPGS